MARLARGARWMGVGLRAVAAMGPACTGSDDDGDGSGGLGGAGTGGANTGGVPFGSVLKFRLGSGKKTIAASGHAVAARVVKRLLRRGPAARDLHRPPRRGAGSRLPTRHRARRRGGLPRLRRPSLPVHAVAARGLAGEAGEAWRRVKTRLRASERRTPSRLVHERRGTDRARALGVFPSSARTLPTLRPFSRPKAPHESRSRAPSKTKVNGRPTFRRLSNTQVGGS